MFKLFALRSLAKISRYEAQCVHFENKYNESLDTFQKYMQQEEKEDFAKEDDLMDWEYADAAFQWWKAQLKDIRRAAWSPGILRFYYLSRGALMNFKVQDQTSNLKEQSEVNDVRQTAWIGEIFWTEWFFLVEGRWKSLNNQINQLNKPIF